MDRAQLAKKLISASDGELAGLLARHRSLADDRLADEIRAICHVSWTSDPVAAQRAAAAMRQLSRIDPTENIRAIEAWVSGISYITLGKFELAVTALNEASQLLDRVGRRYDAAQTQMAKLLSLGMLGRYADAVAAGEKARIVFLKNDDQLAAGKIEVNLANIVSRSGAHTEAEKYCLAARRRFIKLGEKEFQAVAENGLANTYSELNEFEKADRYYRMALETAHVAGMHVTEAEIEASIGGLAQVRGKYADALKFLELSRSKYDSLEMPHQCAIADLEIADLYAELNLAEDAIKIYERVTDAFAALKMRGEEARARLNYGRTAYAAGDLKAAARQLKRSLRLYTLEENNSGQAAAMLAQARLALDSGKAKTAVRFLDDVAVAVRKSENPRDVPAADLLDGEANMRTGNYRRAAAKLDLALTDSRRLKLPDLAQAALNALGRLALKTGDDRAAEKHFRSAIRVIEGLRAPLASEEFSMSFLASRLEAYDHLARIYLQNGRIAQAFRTIESRRSRSLLDAMSRSGKHTLTPDPRLAELEQVRTELNSSYKRLDRADHDEAAELRRDVADREAKLTELTRRIASTGNADAGGTRAADPLKRLPTHLGTDTCMIEYVEFDGLISAFVIGGGKTKFVADFASVTEIRTLLDDLHFQFGALRYGSAAVERFLDQMKARTDQILASLYDLLIKPLRSMVATPSIVIVPVDVLHYVPFHALRDETGYLVESFRITHAPSASVWSSLQERAHKKIKKPLLIGFADERIPLVENEVARIKAILPNSTQLTGGGASFSAFANAVSRHDLIHLACHGQFRPENPMFSSLHLADGWITVNDIFSQSIKAELVTLSACETGLSKVFAGEEVLGLARGFLSAGASALMVSLWTVNDRAAGDLMARVYTCLQRGTDIASSLRDAQLEFVGRGEHPYFWSPFVLMGR